MRDGKKSMVRTHEFVLPKHETHLTATLWENFAVLPCEQWVPRLYQLAGYPHTPTAVRCNWSYEWERPGIGALCDVIVEHESPHGERSVLVVEAKNLTAGLGEKELNFGYYLDRLPEIAEFGERRSLLFLVDQEMRPAVLQQFGDSRPDNVGIVTWQELAGLQIQLARALDVPSEVQSFIAGAIQYQYSQHDIRPSTLAAEYLRQELSVAEIAALPQSDRQTQALRNRPLWRLPPP